MIGAFKDINLPNMTICLYDVPGFFDGRIGTQL